MRGNLNSLMLLAAAMSMGQRGGFSPDLSLDEADLLELDKYRDPTKRRARDADPSAMTPGGRAAGKRARRRNRYRNKRGAE